MKIGPSEPKVSPANAPVAERRNGAAPAAASAEPSAKVQLSASALSSGEDVSFDKAKVERIATAIREGRFEVNSGAIADKLIANAQELLGRTRS